MKAGTGIIKFDHHHAKGTPEAVPDKLAAALLGRQPAGAAAATAPSAAGPIARPSPAPWTRPPLSPSRQWQRLAPVLNGIPFLKIGGILQRLQEGLPRRDQPGRIRQRAGRAGPLLRLGAARGLLTATTNMADLDYEYQMSFVAKCILWAARREPTTRLAGLPEN